MTGYYLLLRGSLEAIAEGDIAWGPYFFLPLSTSRLGSNHQVSTACQSATAAISQGLVGLSSEALGKHGECVKRSLELKVG